MLPNVVVVLVPVGLGHQHLDVLPDQLARVVSEQLFGSRIDALDNAYRIDGNDRIHGRPQHRREVMQGSLRNRLVNVVCLHDDPFETQLDACV